MNSIQLDIFHQQLLLMRTTQEVIDLANGGLTLPPNDPRDKELEELDRIYTSSEDNMPFKEPYVARFSDVACEVIVIIIPKTQ